MSEEFNLKYERRIVRDILIDTLKDMVKVEAIMKEIERVDKELIKWLKECHAKVKGYIKNKRYDSALERLDDLNKMVGEKIVNGVVGE